MKKILTTAALAAAMTSGAFAASNASDNAGNSPYQPGNNWADSSNGGTGFGAWSFSTTGSGGRYIGGSSLGATTFAIYSPDSSTSVANRPFTGSLTAGQSFKVDIANTATINGEIGLNLMSGSNVRWTLKFVTGDTLWRINDGGSDFSSGQAYAANTALSLTFTYNGGSSYSYTFGTGSGNNYTATADISSLDGVKFYSNNQGNDQNMGINNLQVVPEPSTYALLALSAAGFGGYVIRRRRR